MWRGFTIHTALLELIIPQIFLPILSLLSFFFLQYLPSQAVCLHNVTRQTGAEQIESQLTPARVHCCTVYTTVYTGTVQTVQRAALFNDHLISSPGIFRCLVTGCTRHHPLCTFIGDYGQRTWDGDPMFFKCWASVYDAGPALKQHWVNASCWLNADNKWNTPLFSSLFDYTVFIFVEYCLYLHLSSLLGYTHISLMFRWQRVHCLATIPMINTS